MFTGSALQFECIRIRNSRVFANVADLCVGFLVCAFFVCCCCPPLRNKTMPNLNASEPHIVIQIACKIDAVNMALLLDETNYIECDISGFIV